jgi:hypothetical protein
MRLTWLIDLAEILTDAPRYRPNFEWSKNSWTHNVFRCYEWLFGRRYGVRKESDMSQCEEDGLIKVQRRFYTLEARVAYLESLLRFQIESISWKSWLTLFLSLFIPRSAPLVIGAIAYDTSTSVALGASPRSNSHTCTGSNLVLVVFTLITSASDLVTGVTYNSVAMSKVDFITRSDAGDYSISSWCLINPATGANNVTATTSSGTVGFLVSSFSGCGQTSQPDSHNTGSTGVATSITVSSTIVEANSWQVMGMGDSGGSESAGTGTTKRISGTPGGSALFDSNGALSAGSHSLIGNWTGAGTSACACLVAIAPPASFSGEMLWQGRRLHHQLFSNDITVAPY